MRRLALLLLLSGCADPAVLDVEVRIEEVALDRLALRVRRGLEGRTLYECRMPFHQATEGTCPDDDGEGQWIDPRELHFVLYGKPNTEISIELEGLRLERSVTTTATVVALPSNEGERRSAHLTLVGLTRERFRCSAKIEPKDGGETSLNPEEQTSLAVIAGPGAGSARVAIVSARGRLGKVRRARTAEGCTLEYVPIAESLAVTDNGAWCHVSPGSLVAAPWSSTQDEGIILAAATCANGAQARVKAAQFGLAATGIGRVRELPIPRARAQVSPPVLADVIAGDDQRKEVVVLSRQGTTRNDPVELVVWQQMPRVVTSSVVVIALPGVRFEGSLVAPLVIPTRLGDLLVIVGDDSAYGVVREGRFIAVGSDSGGRSLRGPSGIIQGPGLGFELYSIHDGELQRRTITSDTRGMYSVQVDDQILASEVSANVDLRLAIGSVDADEEQEIVVSQNGVAQVYGRSGGAAISIDMWGGTIPGEQAILLANLDRLTGSEIISVGLQSSLLQAADASGRPLDGWPLSLSGQGGRRHVVVSELDGTRDLAALRDVEIVALSSDGIVEVITLGPGSYDGAHVPWPSSTRGAAGPTAYESEADPQQRTSP